MRGSGEPYHNPDTGQWEINANNGADQGFWDVDLWIGGLAEQPLFDGPLGTTFSVIMLDFAQRMQDGDRFYYLYRMPVGHHLGDQIIGEQFADLIMRTTGLEHINGDAFGVPSATYFLDDGANYFNAIYETLPDSVRAFVVANNSFEVDSLATGTLGVATDVVQGNYTTTAPTGWTITGQGGLFAPTAAVNDAAGHTGANVVWLRSGGTLAQDTSVQLAAGATYTLSFNVGDRIGNAGVYPGGTARLVDSSGNVLATTALPTPSVDGGWANVELTTGAITAAQAGLGLRIEIQQNAAGGGNQILIDNVSISETTPGGSANDGHIVIAGLDGNDYLVAALGDDTVYGDAGNDTIEGAQGNDHLYGGAGDDWITDYENDDFISGGDGNDYVSAGPGVLDTIHGNAGDDTLHGGDGIDEVFGDDGNDLLYGDGDTDLMMGGDGHDYMEGGDSVDEMFGGNDNDWMRGCVGDDNINGGSGNDLMEGGLGAVANDGDRLNGDTLPGALPVIEWNGDGTEGDMDIVNYEDVPIAIFASLQTANANGTSSNLLDTYALDEGLVGSAQDDQLEGADVNAITSNGANNYLIGGAGSDTLTGLGGNDYIFGDSAVVDNSLYWIGDARHTSGMVTGTIDNWQGTGETRVTFADGSLGHILGDNGANGTGDTAVFRGNRSQYNIVFNLDGTVTVTDTRTTAADYDGTDTLLDVEFARFADGLHALVAPPPGRYTDRHRLDCPQHRQRPSRQQCGHRQHFGRRRRQHQPHLPADFRHRVHRFGGRHGAEDRRCDDGKHQLHAGGAGDGRGRPDVHGNVHHQHRDERRQHRYRNGWR